MTDHALEKLLADVAGVENIHWTPLTDHNDMALVKAALPGGYTISVQKGEWAYVKVELYDHPKVYVGRHEKDELRAFAEAVVQMQGGKL